MMRLIRQAEEKDAGRISEIRVFCYRMNFYPIFRDDAFYFREMQVNAVMQEVMEALSEMYVYDDGAVKGYVRIQGNEIVQLFVEPVLQGRGIGAALLQFALEKGCTWLWALEKNERAVRFYQRYGFRLTGEKKPEEDTTEYLVRLSR